jgi:surfeit locus 1 family protein
VPLVRLPVGNRVFAPGLLPTLAMLPLLALLLWLGTWQHQRAGEKRALWESFERGADRTVALPAAGAPPLERYAHVRLEGVYVPDRQVLLDNLTHAERVGYRVLTPLRRADGTLVLVDRGWVPLGRTRQDLPDVAVGAEPRVVTGRVDRLPRAGIELANPPDGAGWPRVLSFPTLAQVERVLGRPVYPQVVLLDPELPDGYVREWQPPGLPPERHLGYSVQWFSLAATLLVLWAAVSLKKTTPERTPDPERMPR